MRPTPNPPMPGRLVTILPSITGLMDLKTTDPCGNFFRCACGGWIDANPISPADQSSHGGWTEELTQRAISSSCAPSWSKAATR